jgi:hypothetical protein
MGLLSLEETQAGPLCCAFSRPYWREKVPNGRMRDRESNGSRSVTFGAGVTITPTKNRDLLSRSRLEQFNPRWTDYSALRFPADDLPVRLSCTIS